MNNNNKNIAQAWTFKSSGNGGFYQTLLYVDATTSCDSPGWTRRCKNGQRTCKHTRSVDMHTADEQCVRTVRYVKGVGVKPPVLQQGELKMKVRHFDFTE